MYTYWINQVLFCFVCVILCFYIIFYVIFRFLFYVFVKMSYYLDESC